MSLGLIAGLLLAGATPDPAAALPPGSGRATTARVCTACHEAEVIVHRPDKSVAWPDVIQAMVEKGAEAKPNELAEIRAYLDKTLPTRR
jgi:hypothetical protein